MKQKGNRPTITYLPYRGLWQVNKYNETCIFLSQSEADSKYWQQRFPHHFN